MSFSKMDLEDRKRPQGRNAILVYGYDQQGVEALDTIREHAGIDELIYIDQSKAEQHIEEIIALEEETCEHKLMAHEDQVIVFNSASQYEINAFITKLFKEAPARPIVAMVTPTSIKWRFADLVEELKREKEALKS